MKFKLVRNYALPGINFFIDTREGDTWYSL
jgi:hypothetical protein